MTQKEQRQEQIGRYVAEYTGSYSKTVIATWITDSVTILDAWNVTYPGKAEKQKLKAELIATLPGKKGQPLTEGQADKRILETRKFYEWLKQQEGEKQQMSLGFEETEGTAQGNFEPEAVGTEQAEDIEPISSESVAVEEAEGADHGACVEAKEVTTEEGNAPALSPVVTPESNEAVPVQQATIAPKPKNKGGRKVLDPNGEKRSEKVMLYLRPSLYVDVKDWASLHGQSITDCVIGMIEVYMQGKQGKLALFRELRDNE